MHMYTCLSTRQRLCTRARRASHEICSANAWSRPFQSHAQRRACLDTEAALGWESCMVPKGVRWADYIDQPVPDFPASPPGQGSAGGHASSSPLPRVPPVTSPTPIPALVVRLAKEQQLFDWMDAGVAKLHTKGRQRPYAPWILRNLDFIRQVCRLQPGHNPRLKLPSLCHTPSTLPTTFWSVLSFVSLCHTHPSRPPQSGQSYRVPAMCRPPQPLSCQNKCPSTVCTPNSHAHMRVLFNRQAWPRGQRLFWHHREVRSLKHRFLACHLAAAGDQWYVGRVAWRGAFQERRRTSPPHARARAFAGVSSWCQLLWLERVGPGWMGE